MKEERPNLHSSLSGKEFLRWYYLKSELEKFAKDLGIKRSGSKQEITQRIAAHLDGKPLPVDDKSKIKKIDHLPHSLSLDTTVYPGQKLTKRLRDFMIEECGSGFLFDGHMRKFFMENRVKTLREAVEHWEKTRDLPPPEIESQFEYNRFAKQWHYENPLGTHREMVKAWKRYRSRPR